MKVIQFISFLTDFLISLVVPDGKKMKIARLKRLIEAGFKIADG